MGRDYKKINEGEIIIWGTFLAGLDLLCAFIVLITAGFAEAITVPTQGFVNFWMMQWFKSKGGNAKLGEQIIKYVCGGLLPVGNFGVFVFSAIAHNKLGNVPLLGKQLAK